MADYLASVVHRTAGDSLILPKNHIAGYMGRNPDGRPDPALHRPWRAPADIEGDRVYVAPLRLLLLHGPGLRDWPDGLHRPGEEWTAQWQLRTVLGVDTADFPRDLLPPDADAAPSRDGKVRIGLWRTWQVVDHRLSGSAQAFIAEHGRELHDLLDLRNQSILAHGYRPVGAADRQRVGSWTRERFLPVLRALAAEAGLKGEPSQLPTELPEIVREVV